MKITCENHYSQLHVILLLILFAFVEMYTQASDNFNSNKEPIQVNDLNVTM